MKPAVLIPALLILIFFQRCTDEDSEERLAKLEFTIGPTDEQSGRTKEFTLPVGARLLVTLADKDGITVLSWHELKILRIGSSYLTEPLQLKPGKYIITDFVIADNTDQILFATPKRGAKLASLVDHSLPYAIYVSKDNVSNVAMQVVNVQDHEITALGYTSFNLGFIFPWKLSVMVSEEDKIKLTEAKVFLKDGKKTIFEADISAKVNLLPFQGDPEKSYQLVITKDGFEKHSEEFIYNVYKEKLGDKPFEILLKPRRYLSFTPINNASFSLTTIGKGSLTIDWGDHQVEQIDYSAAPQEATFHFLEHEFPEGAREIKIHGDLQDVIEFVVVSGVSSMDTKHLTSLKSLSLEQSDLNQLDLSKNGKLSALAFVNTTLEELVLPNSHRIESLSIENAYEPWNSNGLLDNLISNVYQNAVSKKIREGGIILFNAGRLSESSMRKLRHLESAYSWYVEIE